MIYTTLLALHGSMMNSSTDVKRLVLFVVKTHGKISSAKHFGYFS